LKKTPAAPSNLFSNDPRVVQWVIAENAKDPAETQLLAVSPGNARNWTATDSKKIQNHYADLLKQHPEESSEASGWIHAGLQKRLFEDLIPIGSLEGQRVMDFGCGLGVFFAFLQEQGITPARYVGLDAAPEIVAKAQVLHPQGEFAQADCFDRKRLTEIFSATPAIDYIFACGLFGVRPAQWQEGEFNRFLLDWLAWIMPHCRKGIAFNFIPWVSPNLKTVMQQVVKWHQDTEEIAFHRIHHLALIRTLQAQGFSVETLPDDLFRLLFQTPVFLRHAN
jgi:SAM-dependent methyltransferase